MSILEEKKMQKIAKPNIKSVTLKIRGTAPYVTNKFSSEARNMMRAKQELGAQAKKGSKKEPKNFEKCARESAHYIEVKRGAVDANTWATLIKHYKPNGDILMAIGVPASSFRQAMISACRLIGFKMTLAKLAVFVKHDGFDADPGEPIPLCVLSGEHSVLEMPVRNETGVADIRARMCFAPGWRLNLSIVYDADIFSEEDVVNLVSRVGLQVGVGAGRPDSKESAGMGWGTFEIIL
jgi:hypothetical protein